MDISQLSVSGEEPGAEDWLGENIEDSIGNDLLVNSGNARAICNTPDAAILSVIFTSIRSSDKTHIG